MRWLLFVTVLFLASCGNHADDSVETRESSIVFKKSTGDGRTVAVSRYHLVRGGFASDQREKERDYQLAAVSRSSALVIMTDDFAPNSHGDCAKRPSDEISHGSSNLVGDFLLTTASHVLVGVPLDAAPNAITVSFGGALGFDALVHEKQIGAWPIDMPGYTTPSVNPYHDYWPYSDDYVYGMTPTPDPSYSSEVLEQETGLVERLWQLSMHSRVPGSDDDLVRFDKNLFRARLGHWVVAVIRNDMEPFPVTPSKDLDFAVLQVTGVDPVFASFSQDHLGVGTVAYKSPAPFVNRVPFEHYADDDHAITTDVPVWASHWNTYPMEQTESWHAYQTPLISRLGVIHPENQVVRPPAGPYTSAPYCHEYCVGPDKKVLCSRGTGVAVDILSGSSGGGILTCQTADCEVYGGDGTTNWKRFPPLAIRGVVQQVGLDPSHIGSGLDSGSWNSPYDYSWFGTAAKPHWALMSPMPELDLKAEYSPEGEVTGCANPKDCGTVPLECVSLIGSDIACTTDNECGNSACESGYCVPACRIWETGAEDNDFGPAPYPLLSDNTELLTQPVVPRAGVFRHWSGCGAMMQKDVPQIVKDRKGRSLSVGGGVGIRGFPTADGIGSFQLVCGPYIDESYTENWRWLRKGASYSELAIGMLGALRKHIVDAMLMEGFAEGEKEPLRPAPTKFCPPNFMLHGLEMTLLEDGRIRGIDALQCVPIDPSVTDTHVWRTPLAAPYKDSDLDHNYSPSYTIQGVPYSLTQQIGHPADGIGPSPRIVACENETDIVEKIFDEYTNGELTGLWLECIPNPM